MAELWERLPVRWSAIFDGKACPDCLELSRTEPMPLAWWISQGKIPGNGRTVCMMRCRCIFLPVTIFEIIPRIENEAFLILEKDTPTLYRERIDKDQYKKYDALVDIYEAITPNFNLPKYVYRNENLAGPAAKKAYLKGLINRIGTNSLTKEDWEGFATSNAPERIAAFERDYL